MTKIKKLTIEELQKAKPHSIIRKGETKIPSLWDIKEESISRFVAVRGGIADWSIYYISKVQLSLIYGISENNFNDLSWEWIADHGQKIYSHTLRKTGKNLVKSLVPCEDEVLNYYRN